jgi:membrane protein DedA with SNARE-associated domain
MEFFAENSTFSLWLLQYGSFALFGLLAVGIIAMPVPEETLMILAGLLMSQGKLSLTLTPIAALTGSMLGITLSYVLGRTAGMYFVHRFGKWVGLTEKRLQKAHDWFEKFGIYTLVIGYFIPGIRHFTGFSAGTTNVEFDRFALFAYLGAFLWVSTFLSLGYFFSDYWIACLACIAS